MNESVSGVYLIRCIPTSKVYVGSSANIELRWTIHRNQLLKGNHTNTYLQAAWAKHGPSNFTWEIIEPVEAGRLIEREQHFIDSLHASARKHGFNLRIFASSNRGLKHSEETKARIGAASKGRECSPELRKKRSEAMKRLAPEIRAKMSAANRGRTHRAETKAKMSASHQGRTLSREHKAKIAERKRGKTATPEARANMSAAARRSRTPEYRAKMSALLRGRRMSEEHRAKLVAGWARRREAKQK